MIYMLMSITNSNSEVRDQLFIISDFERADLVKWKALMEKSAFSNPFHSPQFFQQFSRRQGSEPFFCIVANENEYLGIAAGNIYKQKGISGFFSRRAIIEGGLVIGPDEQDKTTGLLIKSMVKILENKTIYLEIRNYNDYSKFKSIFHDHGFTYLPYLNFHVDCNDLESMKHRINKGKLRQIKSSLNSGAEIIDSPDEAQVKEFYDILRDLYRTRVKKPLPPWEFFKDFNNSTLGTYLLVSYQGRIVGGIMCPYDNRAVYEWYVAGLDNRYDKIYPSVLATWAAMEFANRNNIPRFDFMGAGQTGKDYGVREFKSRFGGELLEYGRFRRVFSPLLFNFGILGLKLLNKIK